MCAQYFLRFLLYDNERITLSQIKNGNGGNWELWRGKQKCRARKKVHVKWKGRRNELLRRSKKNVCIERMNDCV